MKYLFLIIFLISKSTFANSIDSLINDNDVERFVTKVGPRFSTSNKIKILSTTQLLKRLTCDNVAHKWHLKNWEKVDFNADNRTDLFFIAYWTEFLVFVAIDNGDNTFNVIQLSRTGNCELGKPIFRNSEQLLLYYTSNISSSSTSNKIYRTLDKSKTDTLIYKFGGFIEKNENIASYKISEIEFHTSNPWEFADGINKLKISSDKSSTFETNSNMAKFIIEKRVPKNELTSEIIELIQYINLDKIKDNYFVSGSDNSTIFIKIIFKDGTVKKITDYGMIGTFGLSQLYKLLYQLKK
jgi:hypothetical protein